jgi:adsorption protein B
VLHDARDLIHSGELRVLDTLVERFDLVQLPVLPLTDRHSRWISSQNQGMANFCELRAA